MPLVRFHGRPFRARPPSRVFVVVPVTSVRSEALVHERGPDTVRPVTVIWELPENAMPNTPAE
jgi:hypothetical protein